MKTCEICNGNDADAPCAYPSACLRDQRRIAELEEKVKRLQDGLKSIADNTCCKPCQEAALVAKQTLAELAATDKGEG